jgi:hypothetical protein
MTQNKRLARIVGGLFITGTVAGILSAALTAPILSGQDYLTKIAADETPMLIGTLLVLLMGFSLAMVPVVLYPVLRRYSEVLALGAVVFRGALEAIAYVAVVLTWLGLVTVGREFADAGAAATPSLQLTGVFLLGMQDWSSHIVSIVFGIGALMIYGIFFTSRLVPRWLSVWGLIGAVLYLAVALLAVVGVSGLAPLMAPLAVQEMVLAVWLILKGFDAAVMTSSTQADRGAASAPAIGPA